MKKMTRYLIECRKCGTSFITLRSDKVGCSARCCSELLKDGVLNPNGKVVPLKVKKL